MKLEGKDIAELINELDDGFISLDVFDSAIVETNRSVDGYASPNDVKKVAIRKVVEGASSEQWLQQLLKAVLNSDRTENNERLRSLITQLLDKYASSPRSILKKALVIQSLAQADAGRNKRVFEELIRPACAAAGFDADKTINYPPETMKKPINSPIFGHPMVVVDLGNLGAPNPNTLIEIGFRLSTGRPILCFADKALPADIPSHLPAREEILEIDPANPGASVNEMASRLSTSFARGKEEGSEQGWVSEHPWVDWQLSVKNPEKSEYLFANDKAASLYGVASTDEIIGHFVDDVDNRQLYAFMDTAYKDVFLEEQWKIIGRIIRTRVSLDTTATWPLIFSKRQGFDEIHLPVIANYKYDELSESFVFRTVFLRIGRWCTKDFAERSIENQRLPALFRSIYENDFFLCYDTADFDQAESLKTRLTTIGFKVWWPSDEHNSEVDADLSAASLKRALAKSRIAAVLVGSRDRGRWGGQELDDALYKHCEAKKPLILCLLPSATSLEPQVNDWLGKRYKQLLGAPLYMKAESVMDLLSNASRPLGIMSGTSNSLSRILREVMKLMRLSGN